MMVKHKKFAQRSLFSSTMDTKTWVAVGAVAAAAAAATLVLLHSGTLGRLAMSFLRDVKSLGLWVTRRTT